MRIGRGLGLVLVLVITAAGSTSVVATDRSVWQSRGYGQVLAIESGRVQTYDVSKAGCVRSFEEPLAELGRIVEMDDRKMLVEYGINRYHYDRIDSLPAACLDGHGDADDPVLNFDALWHTFNENYAFFEARNVDWQAEYRKYRPQLSRRSTAAELHAVVDAMLSGLGDGHVTLDAPAELQAEDDGQESSSGQPSLFELQQAARAAIVEKHVVDARGYNSGIVRWGWIRDEGAAKIAYIQLNALLMLAQYPVTDSGDIRSFFQEYFAYAENRDYQYLDEVAGANMIMGQILSRIAAADAVILDLRFNGGGKDGAGLAFMNHFVDRGRTVFTKKARNGQAFTPKQAIRLQPAERTYAGPLYLLTSSGTSSAAEIMVLSSLPLEQVVRVGARTEGIFSDTLDKMMPNGWEYTLSNEVYEDMQGNQYEHVGIAPHQALDYPRDQRDFYRHLLDDVADGDDAIEWVIGRHSKASAPGG